MSKIDQKPFLVARRVGSRLLLAGGPSIGLGFEGLSERTIFFREGDAERELRRLRVPLESVELRKAKLTAHVE